MENQYKQLTLGERYQIETFCKPSISSRNIAKDLKRSNKTISNERRNCTPYCAKTAHENTCLRRSPSVKHRKCDDEVQDKINELLILALSPEQIAGRMKEEGDVGAVCTNTIYRLIKSNYLEQMLPRKGKKYRQRQALNAGVINERSTIVDEKQ